MVSTRKRGKAAAALGLAAASLCGKHGGGADAFYAGSSGSSSGPFAFAPAHAQPRWLDGQPSASASPLSTTGRAHRFYVRDRDGGGFESGQHWQRCRRPAGISIFRAAARRGTSGSRRGSTLSMASSEDGAEVSASAVGAEVAAVEPFMPAAIQDSLPEGVQKELSKINRDPAKLSFFLNAAVIFLFAAFAAFKLATVDGDIARGWTWYEVLLRVPGDNFYRYEATVSESPIPTKALTSCVAYGLGDLTAQFFTGKDLETVDLKRTARSATAGLLVHGPLCHFWIELMQTYLDFDGAWWNFIPKVIADQTVWSVFLNAAYSTTIMGLQGKSPDEVWYHVKTTAWPALTSSWRFWPLIHCCSFSKAIPKDLKLLFIDCMEIIWVTILSTVANGDRSDMDGDGDGDDGEMVPVLAASGDMDEISSGSMAAAPAVVMQPPQPPSAELESEHFEGEVIHQ